MTGLAKVTPFPMSADPLIDRRTNKPRRVTAKIKKVVRLLISGECKTLLAAATRSDVSADYVGRALKWPHVRVYIDTQTRDALAAGSMIGASRVLELINGAKSEHVALNAAELALGINGIRPAESGMNININNISPGYIIDLTNPRDALPPEHHLFKHSKEIPHDEENN